ncbi:MAG: metalloregulator ArsR/SmtB family transcription factor [Candidatus Methanoperedens sp.]|nr:metalloregulator ArsR/SmtB family transcription factor [Candidatus Methanoperedens sp.]
MRSKSKDIDHPIVYGEYSLPQRKQRQVRAAIWRDVAPISKIFGILSDPVRMHILLALAVQELCVCVLVEITDHKYSALSYHLKLLKEMELVDSRREGNFLMYRLTGRGRAALDMITNFLETTKEVHK